MVLKSNEFNIYPTPQSQLNAFPEIFIFVKNTFSAINGRRALFGFGMLVNNGLPKCKSNDTFLTFPKRWNNKSGIFEIDVLCRVKWSELD